MMKKVVSLFLALVLLMSTSVSASATERSSASENQLIALNAPSRFGYDMNWLIVQETVLYDLSSEIAAYCYDMTAVDEDTGEIRTSYAIVNADESGFPLLLFGIDGVSAYYNVESDKAYYLGLMDFYVEVDNTIIQPQTMEILDATALVAESSALESELTFAVDFSDLRTIYVNGTMARNAPESDNIENHGYTGSSLQWYKGCAPTAIAMLIKTHFPTLDGNTLIENLAEDMKTTSTGSTDTGDMKAGVKAYFKDHTNLTAPSTYGWNSTHLFTGAPKTGISNNSKESYKSSIQAGFPVGVLLHGTTVVTPGYPAGSITSHMMAGMGYSFSSSGDFITCYTTNVADGLVSFPLTDTGLETHAWFWIKW